MALLSPKAAGHHGWSAHPLGPKALVVMVAGPLSLAEPYHDHSTPKPSAETAWDPHLAVQPRSQPSCCPVKLYRVKYRQRVWIQGWSSGTPSPIEVDGI